MKLKIELKPKEWLLLLLFVVIVHLLLNDNAMLAVELIKYWIMNK